jgi:hypothetical protein
MKPGLDKRHYFLNQQRNKNSTFCRRSGHNKRINYREEYSHYKTVINFGMEISTEESEKMEFLGNNLSDVKSF